MSPLEPSDLSLASELVDTRRVVESLPRDTTFPTTRRHLHRPREPLHDRRLAGLPAGQDLVDDDGGGGEPGRPDRGSPFWI
jgi:hypothetical protein